MCVCKCCEAKPRSITQEVAAELLSMGVKVYKWTDYWQSWSEVLSLRLDGDSRFWNFAERTIGERVIREHSTQMGRYDRLTIERP